MVVRKYVTGLIILSFLILSTQLVMADNSKFYGLYETTMSVGDCDSGKIGLLIGGDESLKELGYYIYIPKDQNNSSYSYNEISGTDTVNVTIIVSGNNITISTKNYTAGTTTLEETHNFELSFAGDYNNFTLSGNHVDYDDPEDCQGGITGSGVKKGDDINTTYDITGLWTNTTTPDLSGADSRCDFREGTDTLTFLQDGSFFFLTSDDEMTFYGNVSSNVYTFSGSHHPNVTSVSGSITMSSSSSYSGSITLEGDDDDSDAHCVIPIKITGVKGAVDSGDSNDGGDTGDNGGNGGINGGGGGGCFVGAAIN